MQRISTAAGSAAPRSAPPIRCVSGPSCGWRRAEPLAVPGPEERAGLMARWRELPASEAREGFVERRAVEWTAMGRHEDPEIAEAGQRPVIRDVEEAAPRFGVEPEVLLAAVVERSEAVQRLVAGGRRAAGAAARGGAGLGAGARLGAGEGPEAPGGARERRAGAAHRRGQAGWRAAAGPGAAGRDRGGGGAGLHEAGLMASEALAGIVPSEDALAPLRAAEAALGGAAAPGRRGAGLEIGTGWWTAVAERTTRCGARGRRPRGPSGSAGWRPRRAARGPFVEANARAWDAALWAEERETARTGHGRAPGEEPEPGSALAKGARAAAHADRARRHPVQGARGGAAGRDPGAGGRARRRAPPRARLRRWRGSRRSGWPSRSACRGRCRCRGWRRRCGRGAS